ncbi:ATP-binding protein [Paractinoplanes brasiliensis]|uniref:ATP-dependent DNA helicase RecG n=1 Tax=Paractinoplanes brasiliensis TaxID=52695 RepID=A0A4R6JQ28_9ACTN|nr:ATP-binding protein [Actinoplanes brasiliensis]TDO38663.1 ATP-dependent DNA helicase RecG [Actinoplanes brasiliensis]GID26559.1 hypothetical protein Abr02nite_15420 [Actinoplanes brasiliensis]
MNEDDLDTLLENLRGHGADHLECEVKRARGGLPVTLWESISAFANVDGGCILLGVDEKSGFTVVGVDDPAQMEAQVAAVCSEMEPPVRAEIRTVRLEGRNVVLCVVPPVPRNQRPCFKRSLGPHQGSRVRVADGDRKMTDYEVAILLSNRSEPRFDVSPVPRATPEDLDQELLAAFLRRIRSTKETFGRVDDERALRMLNVLTSYEGRTVPTLAGLLVFGIYPQTFEPQLNVTFVAYPEAEAGAVGRFGERFIDNRSIDGPIPLMVAQCIQALKHNMKRRSIVSGIFRVDEWEYPEEVLREALVNALVHRDYSEMARGTQVQVELYPDRLVIRNPGGLYGPVDVSSLGTTTITASRNKVLLKILEDTPLGDGRMVCENRGTGIARMLMGLAEAGMEPPRFTDTISSFTVEFPNHTLLDQDSIDWLASLPIGPLSRSQMMALAMMRDGSVLTNATYRTLTGVQDSRTASRELRELAESGVVEQLGTRGSTTYRVISADHPGGLSEKDSGLANADLAVLKALADGPRSRAEIEMASGLATDPVHRALRRLRDGGRVRMLGKPRSPSAKWTLTR